jgi:hypothetical protein
MEISRANRQPGILEGVFPSNYMITAIAGLPVYALGYILELVHFFRRDAIPTRVEYLFLILPPVGALTFFAADIALNWGR